LALGTCLLPLMRLDGTAAIHGRPRAADPGTSSESGEGHQVRCRRPASRPGRRCRPPAPAWPCTAPTRDGGTARTVAVAAARPGCVGVLVVLDTARANGVFVAVTRHRLAKNIAIICCSVQVLPEQHGYGVGIASTFDDEADMLARIVCSHLTQGPERRIAATRRGLSDRCGPARAHARLPAIFVSYHPRSTQS
jgi:hypothetical protein